ncbi:hypothetical protein HanXRQr2_Chr11g0504951 [Helianthus annuus]|uniref:Uncharacterized protein n=1 Tax=Helianthus annuus TaxID=4232 RepID=A0A9K3HRS3_HELAN|nr:hypothetical protein HanXRQr2_Chr11g0504951 [Helianthus annuus]
MVAVTVVVDRQKVVIVVEVRWGWWWCSGVNGGVNGGGVRV